MTPAQAGFGPGLTVKLALMRRDPALRDAGGHVMKMIEAVRMPRPRHAKILPQPKAEPACQKPPAAEGPPILMADGSSSGAGSCRASNKVIRIIMGRAVKNWGQVTGYKLSLDNASPLC